MAATSNLAAVDHVVVLMLENRSFDHRGPGTAPGRLQEPAA